ncbi:hypothetical protein [Corynebacterium pilosum]|uniref:Secreted protein n=1 Tax=Corynebacterium pilosum TaxID=35756 RepID=A0A376CMU2_9CORY|nr:hypothetical protein [Corynebacterium pilosum]STC69419.1 Uncharacterised protein [Corynebacterium pilosum]
MASKAGWLATGIAAIMVACAPVAAAKPDLAWDDETAKPGETVVLEPTGEPSSLESGRVRISEDTHLPAGWSVWGQNGTFRVAVPASAEEGECVTLDLVAEDGSLIDEVEITVTNKVSPENTMEATPTSQPPSWVTGLVATLAQIFG